MVETVKAKFQRRKHNKSRLGCPQCKHKKVKCDETLPACLNCASKKIRCSYLDYSSKQIETILLAHWEAEGSDPAKNPIASQQYNPTKPLIVQRHDQHLINNRIEEVKSSADFRFAPDYNHPVQYWTENLKILNHESSPFDKSQRKKGDENVIPSPDSITSLTYALDELELPLVSHELNQPNIADFKKIKPFFNEAITSTFSRIYCLQKVHFKITSSFDNLLVFNALQLQGVGTFLSDIPELKSIYLKYRGLCMNSIVKGLSNVTDSNILTLLTAISLLNDSSVYFEIEDEIESFKNHFALASGPGSLLKEAYSNPSLFPNSFKTLKQHADSLMFTTKYVWFPSYTPEVIVEFYEIIQEFGNLYIENSEDGISPQVIDQYNNMTEFITQCLTLFQNESSREHVLKYPIDKLYKLIQKWFSIVPSEMFSLGYKNYSPVERVFYVFWFTLLQLLEMILTGCRYIFTFFLDGYYLCYTFQKDLLMKDIKDDKLIWYLNYSCRIISFFIRRKSYILRNTVLNDLIPNFLVLKDRLKARPLDIQERFIKSFKQTVISKIHYPVDSMKSTNLAINNPNNFTIKHDTDNNSSIMNQYINNYYGQSGTPEVFPVNETETSSGPSTSIMTYHETTLDDYFNIDFLNDDKGRSELSESDFINNINETNSLLNNDYDPRFIDPIFNEKVIFQSTDLEFINRYIEDRRLIIEMDYN